MLQVDPLLKIIVITGQGDRTNALQAIGRGAYDFFCKPIDVEALRIVLARAQYLYQLETEHHRILADVVISLGYETAHEHENGK